MPLIAARLHVVILVSHYIVSASVHQLKKSKKWSGCVGRYLGDRLRDSIQAMYGEPFCAFSLARLPPFSVWTFSPISVYPVVQHHTYTQTIHSLSLHRMYLIYAHLPNLSYCLQFALKFTVTYFFIVLLEFLLQTRRVFEQYVGL